MFHLIFRLYNDSMKSKAQEICEDILNQPRPIERLTRVIYASVIQPIKVSLEFGMEKDAIREMHLKNFHEFQTPPSPLAEELSHLDDSHFSQAWEKAYTEATCLIDFEKTTQ